MKAVSMKAVSMKAVLLNSWWYTVRSVALAPQAKQDRLLSQIYHRLSGSTMYLDECLTHVHSEDQKPLKNFMYMHSKEQVLTVTTGKE